MKRWAYILLHRFTDGSSHVINVDSYIAKSFFCNFYFFRKNLSVVDISEGEWFEPTLFNTTLRTKRKCKQKLFQRFEWVSFLWEISVFGFDHKNIQAGNEIHNLQFPWEGTIWVQRSNSLPLTPAFEIIYQWPHISFKIQVSSVRRWTLSETDKVAPDQNKL